MTRFDLISPRERKDGKTYWHKVGAAFEREKGGYSLVFDSLPLPDKDGRVSLLMTEPLERDGDRGALARRDDSPGRIVNHTPGKQESGYSIQDDDIPF